MKKKKAENQDITKKTEKTNADKKQQSGNGKFLPAFLGACVIILLCSGACVYLYPLELSEQIRTMVTVALFLLLLLFSEIRSRIAGDYLYDNAAHRGRFYMAYVVLFALACFFPMFTRTGWPFLFYAVVLTLFGNSITGMVSYVSILSFTCLVGQTDFQTFLFYFFTGMCVVILFSVLDENFRIEIPVILSLLCFMVSLCANLIITQNANLSFQMFLVPLISLFLNTVLMIMFLWFVNISVINREKSRYQEINDPEFELMAKMKEAGKQHYYQAIHTAYLCNKIASRLSMDTDAVRAAGFYHGAGIIKGEDSLENLMEICREYEFPEKVCDILREYKQNGRILNKETAVVLMSSAVIDAIMSLFEQDHDAKIQYHEVIGHLFQKKTEKGIFDKCNISIYEMNQMKKILVEENLYYDFLR